MKIVMAGSAEDQRLAATSSHDLDPERLFPTIVLLQVFEGPDVMDFHLFGHAGGSADFANLCQESFFEFRSAAPFPLRLVFDGCLHIPR